MSCSDIVSIITSILMVVITLVYVIATVRILKANENAVKTANDQLNESKRQYEDKRRLEVLPYIKIGNAAAKDCTFQHHIVLNGEDQPNARVVFCPTRFKNIGLGTAIDLQITFSNGLMHDNGKFPIIALTKDEHATINLIFVFEDVKRIDDDIVAYLWFNDLLGNRYSQELKFSVKKDTVNNSLYILEKESSSPQFLRD